MNLKKILLTALVSSTAFGVMAVPAKRDLRTFRQSDGTEISVRLLGDEHFHTFVTTDGLTVAREADGDFYYRTSNGVSAVRAHNPEIRAISEKVFIKKEGSSLTMESLAKSRIDAINSRKVNNVATRATAHTQVPNNGSPRVPILLVQYKDKKFKDSDPLATFEKFFVSGSVSALGYFRDQSNGLYTPQFDVYGPYTLSEERSVYGGNDFSGNDKGVGKMVAEGAIGLDAKVDFSKYDNDGDGECDVLIVLYAGDGEASSYDSDAENAVWPCQWSLSGSDYRRSLTLDNTLINKFAVFNELNGENLRKIDGIGTFCHEFSHCLGLPDFYDTKYGNHFGMAHWSLMDYGSYNNDGYTPIGYSAYEKEFMGWLKIDEGKGNTLYKLPVFNSLKSENDKAVKLTNPKNKDEYFIIENRQKQNWDEYMPAEGLFIYHVTYDENAWEDNVVNNYIPQRMTPVPADNSLKMYSQVYYGEVNYYVDEKDVLGDLWPYNGNNEFTDSSSPAQNLNSGGKLGKPVTEITKNSDGTISFWLMKGENEKLAVPVLSDHKIESTTSATINWESGLEDDATFTLEVREHSEKRDPELVISTIFDNENHGWEVDGYGAIEDGSIRLGSSKQGGIVTSPTFTGESDGLVSVIFNAKNYNNDASSAIVAVVDGSYNTIDEKKVSLTKEFKDYTVLLSGNADSDMRVTISIEAAKKRIFLKSADIYTGDVTENNTRSGNDVITITGIEGTSHTLTGLSECGVYDYRIKAVPRDASAYYESDWSERKTFDLSYSNATVIDELVNDNSKVEYFTLQGLKIEKPVLPGIYIVKKGSKSYKKAF
ncbi:MAG: M6 family metalloprotease domain-containing protein [Muribaculaceae bacterium]|nr:M6 family metalloprotease domain-containing protein [Muribaculaceae bacterium]